MAEVAIKLPVKNEAKETTARTPSMNGWPQFDAMRREADRLFSGFPFASWRLPVRATLWDVGSPWRQDWRWTTVPAVDVVEKDNAYEVSAELPGLDEKNIDVNYADGVLTIKGAKEEAIDEKRKGYQLSERRYGSFERSFAVPKGVDAGQIKASFGNGILTITLPKTPDAATQKIPVSLAK